MSRIMKKRYEIPSFARHLHRFCQPERGCVLRKEAEKHRRAATGSATLPCNTFVIMKVIVEGGNGP